MAGDLAARSGEVPSPSAEVVRTEGDGETTSAAVAADKLMERPLLGKFPLHEQKSSSHEAMERQHLEKSPQIS